MFNHIYFKDLSEEKSPDIDVLGESLIEIIDSYSKFKKVIKMSAPNPYLSALGGLMDKLVTFIDNYSKLRITFCKKYML